MKRTQSEEEELSDYDDEDIINSDSDEELPENDDDLINPDSDDSEVEEASSNVVSGYVYGRDENHEKLQEMLEKAKKLYPVGDYRIKSKCIWRKKEQWVILCKHFIFKGNCTQCKTLCPHFMDKNVCVYCTNRRELQKSRPKQRLKTTDPNVVWAERKKKKTGESAKKEPKYVINLQKIEDAKKEGYIDSRHDNICCSKCNRIKVAYERSDRTPIDETTHAETGFLKSGFLISWCSRCMECNANYSNNYNQAPEHFNGVIAGSTIMTHVKGTKDDFVNVAKHIRNRDKDICYTCGIQVIAQTKSGWKQLSINDKNPDLRTQDKNVLIDDLVLTCLACNLFQNSLSWKECIDALHTIANTPPVIQDDSIDSNYISSLPRKQAAWIKLSRAKERCPRDMKIQAAEKSRGICQLLHIPVVFESNHWNTAAFDRINTKIGYNDPNNVQVAANHANYVKKGAITLEEFNEWVQHIRTTPRFKQPKENLY